MARSFLVTSRDVVGKTMNVRLNIDGETKLVKLKDYEDETENLRAWCRALKTFEDEIKEKNGK